MNETTVGQVWTGFKLNRGYFYTIKLYGPDGRVKDERTECGFRTQHAAMLCGSERRLGLISMFKATRVAK